MRPDRYDEHTLVQELDALNSLTSLPWQLEEGALTKCFRFGDFREAFAFMTRVAEIADEMDHHPEWRNIYNRVDIRLSTHDANGVTELDFKLARAMEAASRTLN